MNFDFLKGLTGLDAAYRPSTSAEKLLKSDPNSSMVLSRNSAELLARFIYLSAYCKEAQFMNFVDILADPKVRRFLNNPKVMDAFHFIRKAGNNAAHTDPQFEEQKALDVLKKLHYVAGETAMDLDLIHSYPDFDENIAVYPDAVFDDQLSIPEEVIRMFIDYVSLHEKDEYSHLISVDCNNPAHWQYLLHGHVEMHERLEFDHAPYYVSTTELLLRYLRFMIKCSQESKAASHEFCDFRLTLTLDGEVIPQDACYEALLFRLPQAQSFVIDLYALGAFRPIEDGYQAQIIAEDEPWQGRGLADELEAIKRRESFTYKAVFYYPDDDSHTEFFCIRNGKSYDAADLCTPDILSLAKGCHFIGNLRCLYADYDYQAHPQLVQQLRDAVRAYLPADALADQQNEWEEMDEEGTLGYLLVDPIIDNDDDLTRTQRLVDQVNQLLAPIAQQCTIYNGYSVGLSKDKAPAPDHPALAHCFFDMEHFGVAALVWRDHRLQLVGTLL